MSIDQLNYVSTKDSSRPRRSFCEVTGNDGKIIKYEKGTLEGTGTYSTVYELNATPDGAPDGAPSRVIKIVHPDNQDSKSSYEEAKLTALFLGSTAYQKRKTEKDPDYIAMRKAPGVLLGKFTFSSPSQFLQVFIEIFKAVKAMHDKNRVHHDLKGNNIFIECVGENIIITLIDFGFTTSIDSPSLVLSSRYHAPELKQENTKAHPNQDVYSLGVICQAVLSLDSKRNENEKFFPFYLAVKLDAYSKKMLEQNPAKRPSLTDAIKEFEGMTHLIKNQDGLKLFLKSLITSPCDITQAFTLLDRHKENAELYVKCLYVLNTIYFEERSKLPMYTGCCLFGHSKIQKVKGSDKLKAIKLEELNAETVLKLRNEDSALSSGKLGQLTSRLLEGCKRLPPSAKKEESVKPALSFSQHK